MLEALKGDRKEVEIARAYGIHPTTISNWKREFLEKGPELFGKDKTVAQYEKRIKEKGDSWQWLEVISKVSRGRS